MCTSKLRGRRSDMKKQFYGNHFTSSFDSAREKKRYLGTCLMLRLSICTKNKINCTDCNSYCNIPQSSKILTHLAPNLYWFHLLWILVQMSLYISFIHLTNVCFCGWKKWVAPPSSSCSTLLPLSEDMQDVVR